MAYLDLELPTADARLLHNYQRALCHDVVARCDVLRRNTDDGKIVMRVTSTALELKFVAAEYVDICGRDVSVDDLVAEIVDLDDEA
jgi:hypothetical protein